MSSADLAPIVAGSVPPRGERYLGCALEQGWETTYEAEYVAVARLQADALVTVDSATATKVENLVPVAPLEALIKNGP